MCGKGTIKIKFYQLNIALGPEVKVSAEAHLWQPPRPTTGDIQPGDVLPIIESLSGWPYSVSLMQWGITLPDRQNPSQLRTFGNARAEKMTTTWREDFTSGKRCIVPMTGFFEHSRERGEDYIFSLDEAATKPMLFAAIHNITWPHRQFSIVTVPANRKVELVHDRMPVILTWEQAQEWMAYRTSNTRLQSLLVPYQGALVRQRMPAKVAA